ncbi:hypothetical protein BDQ17DRAFT_1334847 [Cyathus striatus]|nr:hypothetical protein BDQ17DRAFT_1334847 [Cyathus striatus]
MAKSDGIYPNQRLRMKYNEMAKSDGIYPNRILKVVILSLPDNITMETLASSDGIYPNRMLKVVILSLPDNITMETLASTVQAWEFMRTQAHSTETMLALQN